MIGQFVLVPDYYNSLGTVVGRRRKGDSAEYYVFIHDGRRKSETYFWIAEEDIRAPYVAD